MTDFNVKLSQFSEYVGLGMCKSKGDLPDAK